MNFAVAGCENQASICVDVHLAGASDFELNPFGIGAGSYREVVFQLAVVAVIDQINSGVNAFVSDLRVRGNISLPLRGIVSYEIVDLPELWHLSHDDRIPDRAEKPELQSGALGRSGGNRSSGRRVGHDLAGPQREHHSIAGEKRSVSQTTQNKPDLGVGLTVVRFERQRQLAVVGIDRSAGGPLRPGLCARSCGSSDCHKEGPCQNF